MATSENADRLLADWLRHWDTSRRILVEKSPPNLVRTRFLQALFPGARFVIIQRHPLAAAYATLKWTPRRWVHSLLEHWLVCHEQFERDRPLLKRVHVMRYEDFVEDPQRELNALFAFMELVPVEASREVEKGINAVYLAKWQARRDNFLTKPYTSWIIKRLEHRVRRFGYSLVHTGAQPRWPSSTS